MLVDCDVHPNLARPDDLAEYIDEQFLKRFWGRPHSSVVYPPPNGGFRADAGVPGGFRPGSDPKVFEQQLLQTAGVDYAIHIPLVASQNLDPEYNAALNAAVNRWMAETWLTAYNAHGKYRGSISVPLNNPAAAVAEIERWADHPGFVQIWVPHRAPVPYGHPQYHPIWEAAAQHGLPVAIHASGAGQAAMSTPVGFVHYYLELHAVAEAFAYSAHLTSFICEGVFERFPQFRVVLVEGGFAWAAPLIWRLDRAFDQLQLDCPRLQKRPSEYLYGNVRFTTQPVEEPDDDQRLLRLFEMVDASRLLMFATDYPHWDYDDPKRALPKVGPEARRKITYENACELYGLPIQKSGQ
jgi:predicted TIM-barrel fold metal-dependent hydrolase